MAEDILYERQGRVRLITINRADQMNSLDFAANDRLTDIWREFAADDEPRSLPAPETRPFAPVRI